MIVVPIEARAAFILESRFRPLFEQTGFLVESGRPTDLHLQSKSAKGDPKEKKERKGKKKIGTEIKTNKQRNEGKTTEQT